MYLIFGGTCYYASGGANDLIGRHDDKSSAVQIAVDCLGMRAVTYKANNDDWDEDDYHDIEWVQVFDTELMEFVFKSEEKPHGEIDGIISVENALN